MSASQKPTRRRSARLAFDEEEDARPAKKQKTTETSSSAASKPAAGRKAASTSRKAKPSYDEDADGFQFSRSKAKKTRAKSPARLPAKASKVASPPPATTASKDTAPEKPVPSESSRGKRSAPEAQVEEQDQPQRRRSKRLSGDKVEPLPRPTTKSRAPPKTKAKTSAKTAPKDAVKDAVTAAEEEVPRGRDMMTPAPSEPRAVSPRRVQQLRDEEGEQPKGPTKIALPFADTPVIQRNKEMRKNSAQGGRRSSAGMRGRRASSLIDAGTSNALPHSSVETSEFYKHINQDILEPRRMKQLLVWCGTRALPEKPTGTAENVNAILAARVIQEELLKDFSNKSEMSDWFNREDIAPASLIKKPNPRNVQNAAKLQELELEVKRRVQSHCHKHFGIVDHFHRLQEEKASWDSLLAGLAGTISKESSADQTASSSADGEVNPSLLTEKEAELLQNITSQDDILENTISRFRQATEGLELNIDNLADNVHKIGKVAEAVDELADRVQSEAASALERRERDNLQKTGTEKIGVGDILRSLARSG